MLVIGFFRFVPLQKWKKRQELQRIKRDEFVLCEVVWSCKATIEVLDENNGTCGILLFMYDMHSYYWWMLAIQRESDPLYI